MPTYVYQCANGHRFERLLRMKDCHLPQVCECGEAGKKQITKPMFGFVQRDICYDSPIDGRHITNKQARIEDLKRNGCIEYDPEMKTDYLRRLAEQEKAVEKHVEETVDREIHAMPSRKREKLVAELHGGMDVELVRQATQPSEA